MNKILWWFFGTEIGARVELQLLENLVASSLSLSARNLLFKPRDKALEEFAELTARHLPYCQSAEHERLYGRSLSMGRRLRSVLVDRSDEQISRLIIRLYRNIGIEMEGLLPEHVRVSRCMFSRHYQPQTCSIASLMDSGIIEGLFGRGRLTFSARITEGQPCCSCHLQIKETK